MKAKEIREMSLQDLRERIETEKQNLSVTKMNHVISPLDNTSVIAKSRRDIARMITILQEREKSESAK
jgi:large subunit ribosomal protein L29